VQLEAFQLVLLGSGLVSTYAGRACRALPARRMLRAALTSAWAASEVNSYSPMGSVVPTGMKVPRWSWEGLDASS